MQILRHPTAIIVNSQSEKELIDLIYTAAKLCYKTEKSSDITEKKVKFLNKLLAQGHTSPFEHAHISMIIETDRGVTHELVRHRIGAYNQESTRYCNYSRGKFGNEIRVMMPQYYGPEQYKIEDFWTSQCLRAEQVYMNMIAAGAPPEIARSVLPICTATSIMVTYDIPMWRHVLIQRLDKAAHPAMRETMLYALNSLYHEYPKFFDDLWTAYYSEVPGEQSQINI